MDKKMQDYVSKLSPEDQESLRKLRGSMTGSMPEEEGLQEPELDPISLALTPQSTITSVLKGIARRSAANEYNKNEKRRQGRGLKDSEVHEMKTPEQLKLDVDMTAAEQKLLRGDGNSTLSNRRTSANNPEVTVFKNDTPHINTRALDTNTISGDDYKNKIAKLLADREAARQAKKQILP